MVKHEIMRRLHEVLLYMHFLSATSYEASVEVDDIARHVQTMDEDQIRETLRCCKELDYVRESNGRYYLTYKGIISALSISS